MEMNNFQGGSHVAQQSRRDKLRVQQNFDPNQHLEDYANNLEQFSVHPGLSPDLIQFRSLKYGSISYDPTVFNSEMLNYVTKNSQVLLAQNDSLGVHQDPDAAQVNRPLSADNVLFGNLSRPISSSHNLAAKVSGDPHNCGTWKSIGAQQSCDWIANYSNHSTHENNPNPMFDGEGVSGSLKVNNISQSSFYMKPNCYGFQDPSNEASNHVQKQFGEMQCSSPFYLNTIQEIGSHGVDIREIGRGCWANGGKDSSELLLLPTYGDNHSNLMRINNASTWVNRPVEGLFQWNGGGGGLTNRSDRDRKTIGDSSNTQGLSLSLSSVPRPQTQEVTFAKRDDSEDLHSRIGSRGFEITRQNLTGTSTIIHRNAGPFGPFTGYATILKSSKYLKPTLQLLDEFCTATGSKQMKTSEVYSEKISDEVRISADVAESLIGAKGNGDSGASSSTFYSSNDISGEAGGGNSSRESHQPEYHQKKAKLLYMQDEVCRRYKQYHQQMQMVVSSFESVAGLSAATPYIMVALKTISRHFRSLKSAISDQLQHIGKALGEDFSSPTAGTSSSAKGDTSTSRLKFMEHSFQKQKCGGRNMAFFDPQQPVWRPQRGLPERAVAVLRAWLFDHFLHPYPTDTDKHMLATQTGLTRNQVSNWFINARVRVWKPMVEEIHVLETKGLAEQSSQGAKANEISASENASHPNGTQPTDNLSGMNTLRSLRDGLSSEPWNQEKRSRVECHIPASMDGSLMSFVPYQRGGLEIGGLGAVSLTLGLRQSAESAQQQQQHLQQEHQLRQHFGGQIIHDFVG